MVSGGWQRVAYRAGWSVLGPLVAPLLAWHPRTRSALRERLGRLGGVTRGAVWLHGASAGDVRALAPIAAVLERAGVPLLVTASTRAGRELAARDGRGDVRAQPLDHPLCVGHALDAVAPRALILEARELWPELVLGAAERGVPCVVIDARVSERSARAYRRWRGLCGPLLAAPAAWCAVDAAAAEELVALGVDEARVRVTGDVKIEAALDAAAEGEAGAEAEPGVDARAAAGPAPRGSADGAPRVVLGSVHAAECAELLAALGPVAAERPAARFELVARYPAEGAAIARGVARAGLGERVVVRAELGVLRAAYRGATAAFVGGSLDGRGGHNVIEPAAAGVPFAIGPSRRNARAALAALRGPGVVEADGAAGAAAAIGRWLAEPAAARAEGAALRARALGARGALERTCVALRALGLPA